MPPIIAEVETELTNLQFALALMSGVGISLLVCLGLNAVELGLSALEFIPWPS